MIFYVSEYLKVCNFADNTIFYVYKKIPASVINRLKHDSSLTIIWFKSKNIKSNREKCHFLIPRYKHKSIWIKRGQTKIWESGK